ncbi:hypothetical protein OAN22_01465 [Alphaproteobacteria bacterium]|nr:hypothetical protein [Alphaproteobacteria bacterium]
MLTKLEAAKEQKKAFSARKVQRFFRTQIDAKLKAEEERHVETNAIHVVAKLPENYPLLDWCNVLYFPKSKTKASIDIKIAEFSSSEGAAKAGGSISKVRPEILTKSCLLQIGGKDPLGLKPAQKLTIVKTVKSEKDQGSTEGFKGISFIEGLIMKRNDDMDRSVVMVLSRENDYFVSESGKIYTSFVLEKIFLSGAAKSEGSHAERDFVLAGDHLKNLWP